MNSKWLHSTLFGAAILLSSQISLAEEASPREFIISPANNAVVESPVTIKFGLENMELSPAGVENPNGGHHHLLVDVPLPTDLTLPIPADEHHIHFGKAQTETTLELSPGKHTLQLLLGDYVHRPQAKPIYSDVITITVKAKEETSEKMKKKMK